MSPITHWIETDPEARAAARKALEKALSRKDGRVRSGCKAKPIHYGGAVYATWARACAATGKTKDAIRHAIKMAKRATL